MRVTVPDLVQAFGVPAETLFEVLEGALQLGVRLLKPFEVRGLDVREERLDGQVVVLGRVTVAEGAGPDATLVRMQCQGRSSPADLDGVVSSTTA
ncbi:hypothetical protein [Actinomadura verrucosospora]|uniref:hypothetical protein n=1 Tax=Actinomadura verrucosospora TaxID=46165 RepID=UPI001564FCCB|nr:hypothetical protein [Actinomadura verrucosospora]